MEAHFYHYLLLSLATLQCITSVQYAVVNDAPTTPDGIRFTNKLGDNFTEQSMETTTNFIWNTMFNETKPEDRKQVDLVTLNIVVLPTASGVTSGAIVNISADHLQKTVVDLKIDFTALLYHEMTHVWQWFGGDQYKANNGLIEGIADYTVLRAAGGYATGFAQKGEGDNWDEGYSVTARFLEYCEGIKPGFVAELNKLLKDDYSDDYFKQLLGKSVDDLWKEYKAKYSGCVSREKTLLTRDYNTLEMV